MPFTCLFTQRQKLCNSNATKAIKIVLSASLLLRPCNHEMHRIIWSRVSYYMELGISLCFCSVAKYDDQDVKSELIEGNVSLQDIVILTDALRGPGSPRGWKRGLWVLPHCHNHSVQQAGRRRCCSTSCLRSESTPSPGHCFKIHHFNLQFSTFELYCYPPWMIEDFILTKPYLVKIF